MTTNRKIKQLFLNQPIQLVWDRTQGITDKGQLYVGGRAGPSVNIVNLCHEMAHFVEIDDERCDALEWGFRYPEVWIYDRMCIEPTTHQMTDRECRVAALQQSLLAYVGRPLSARTLVRTFYHLPDHYIVPGTNEQARLKWCADRVKELSVLPEYGLDYFMHEWARKNTVLGSRRKEKTVSVISDMRQILGEGARKLTKGEEKILAVIKKAEALGAYSGQDPKNKFVQRLRDNGEIAYIRSPKKGAGWVIAGGPLDDVSLRAEP